MCHEEKAHSPGVRSSTSSTNHGHFPAIGLVDGQVVHHEDVVGWVRRHQYLFDIGEKSRAVHGVLEDHGCCHALQPKCADEGRGFPMPVRHGCPAAVAAQGLPTASDHRDRAAYQH